MPPTAGRSLPRHRRLVVVVYFQECIPKRSTRDKPVFQSERRTGIKARDERMADLRILIIDDSETTRRILRAIVHSRDWKVCGEADSGRSGIAKFQELKPDLVLIDLAKPDINGIEAAKRMS